jgi:hypothetical protein
MSLTAGQGAANTLYRGCGLVMMSFFVAIVFFQAYLCDV